MKLPISLLLLLWSLSLGVPAFASDLFPFAMPWDDASVNLTNLASWNSKPAGRDGFVRVENGHLYQGTERLRLFGVNIVFGSVAPGREEADKLAARLARLGVNAVRFHHMDTRPAPNGLLTKDKRTLDPAVLDRLDYFIFALKREGIYSDLNLHVGRNYPGFKGWGPDIPKYWKGVDIFYGPMVDLQKEYARDLLTHRNPYTGNRYCDEPAVALVEINNEDGLLREWRTGNLDEMTEPFLGDLRRRWNTSLRSQYSDNAGLRAAWGIREETLGAPMLTDAVTSKSGAAGWNLQVIGNAKATLNRAGGGALELSADARGAEHWHIQVHQNRLSFTAGKPYTVTLRLRADSEIEVSLAAMHAHAPWKTLWDRKVKIGAVPRDYRFTFTTTATEEAARFTIGNLGRYVGHLYVEGADLRPGGVLGLKSGESLEGSGLDVPSSSDLSGMTEAGRRDWLRFLWETERAYWTGFHRFLREDLGVKQPVVGTQASYSPAPIQAELDVVDAHAYWQHPRFPGKPWDIDDWLIGNSPMAGIDGGGTIADLAFRRVPGKPFIVSEYNHSAPSHFQGEALPLAAAYAALQDWDGLFLYSWGAHEGDWKAASIRNFFDSHANPVKAASLIPAAAIFRRGDAAPGLPPERREFPPLTAWLDALAGEARMGGGDSLGAPRNLALRQQVGISTARSVPIALPVSSDTGELTWGLRGEGGPAVSLSAARSAALIGYRLGRPISLSGVAIELTEARNGWGALSATVLEGKSFSGPCRILITALGQVENTGQQWLDEKKTTLGRHFGTAPTLVEGLGFRISLPSGTVAARAWALDERGGRGEEIPVSGGPGAVVEFSARYRTLWYEVEVK